MIKINFTDNQYPDSLRNIPNPPKQLFLEGNTDLLNSYSIAIIGSRRFSENGKQLAEKFATELSMSGITIVSGLAVGIDSFAHYSSYRNKGKTVAVLGGGLERIYPKENIPLYNEILNNHGLIISEYPPKELYQKKYFLERNRIISGLSLGVLVIEAAYRSGTSVTAKNAMKQRRPVFSVPHEIWDSHGVGTNMLIKKGANLITSSQDILDYLKLLDIKKKYLALKEKGTFDNLLQISPINHKKSVNKTVSVYNEHAPLIKETKAKIVYDVIFNQENPITINNIAQQTNLSINDISSITFMLELDGHIRKTEGGYICI